MGRKKRKIAISTSESDGTSRVHNEEGMTMTTTTTGSTGTALIPASDPKREQQQQQNNGDDSPVTVAAAAVDGPTLIAPPPPPVTGSPGLVVVAKLRKGENIINTKMNSSGYAMTTHSAEIIDEDVYVSDGSESDEDLMAAELPTEETKKDGDEEEETSDEIILAKKRDAQAKSRSIEMVLGASKMGLMRRGIHHHSLLVQPNRQWSRQSLQQQQLLLKSSTGDDDNMDGNGKEDAAAAEERRRREEEEELAKLDPAQRAARLLAEKQRKLEEAKIAARRLESEENAGRDPCLFSKRTSFDIRFDQIEDKPWTRGGDLSDFFNYGFQEEDWLEYAEQQLLIRQELMDANRQKRPPDPGIVPVAPKASKSQTSRVTLSLNGTSDKDGSTKADNNDNGDDDDDGNAPVAGPQMVKTDHDMITGAVDDGLKPDETVLGPVKNDFTNIVDVNPGIGGAWATPAPGSKLAQLIADQERQMEHVQQHPHDPFIVDGREPSITDDIDDTMSMVSSQFGGPGQISNRHPPPPYHHQHQNQQEYHAPYPPRGGGGRGGGRSVGRGRGPWNPGRGGGRGDWNNHGGEIGYGGGGGGPPPDGNWKGGGGGAVYNNFHNNNDHRGGPPPPPPPPLHPHGSHSPRFQGRGGGGFRGGRGGNGGRFGGRGGGRGHYR